LSFLFILGDPRAFRQIARLLSILQTTCEVQHMAIAVALEESAKGFTRDAGFVRTVYDDLVHSAERLERQQARIFGSVDEAGQVSVWFERPAGRLVGQCREPSA